MRNGKFLSKKSIGPIIAFGCLALYILLLFTFAVFITSILLIAIIIVIPPVITSLPRKNKELTMKRIKGGCYVLGFFILFLFPAFWQIPNQIYRRVNRNSTLITPDSPAVINAANEILTYNPTFNSLNFSEKANIALNYTLDKVKWKVDYETYGLAGHVATPTECLTLGADDCQGQAVTLASILIRLGFEYVWAVETPFHWYVLSRNPSLGMLQQGWEKDVETYQDSGELLALNRDGGGDMPEWRFEEVILIFNDTATLYPVSPLEAILISWTATAFFYDDVFPLFESPSIIVFLLTMYILAIPIVAWTSYNLPRISKSMSGKKMPSKKVILTKIFMIGSLVFAVFYIWYLLQPIIWDWTLILSIVELSAICTISSERFTWSWLERKIRKKE